MSERSELKGIRDERYVVTADNGQERLIQNLDPALLGLLRCVFNQGACRFISVVTSLLDETGQVDIGTAIVIVVIGLDVAVIVVAVEVVLGLAAAESLDHALDLVNASRHIVRRIGFGPFQELGVILLSIQQRWKFRRRRRRRHRRR